MMKEVWLESAREDLLRAKKKFDIGDFKGTCINARISATKSIYSALSNCDNSKYIDDLEALYSKITAVIGEDKEIAEAVKFLSRFLLYEDIVTPYIVDKWLGLPTQQEAERAIHYAEALLDKFRVK